jgi:sugar (pentulose or hexulose) kinase/phosphoglycerate dehydrogenase-like enzyme/ribulose-5-phosphate 4-epimerase/fuculose-1-phosphate aldolase/putative sterol carrier protein
VKQYLMGLDLGGKKGRCLLLDVESGAAVSTCRPWQHRMTAGFGYDLDTVDVWHCFGEAARDAMAKVGARPQDVLAVSTTGMRHGSVVLGAGGEILLATPTRDARGAMHGLQLAAERGREFHERTGHFPAPLFTASLLLWMADSAPELFRRAHAVLGLSDWLAYRLSGKMVAEPSVASENGLFEVGARRWADDLIRSLGLPRHLFPEVVSSGTSLGPLGKDAAAHLGLQPGIPVVTGGGDTQCGLLGASAVDSGQIGIIAGSTMPLQWVLERGFIDPEARLWTSHHVAQGRWTLESNGGPSGDMIDWLAGVIYSGLGDPAAALFAEASQSVVGAEGIVSTLGAEVFNASRLRLPLGHLTLSPMMVADDPSRRRHLSRAVVEGLAFAVRGNLELLQRAVQNGSVQSIRLAGGMSKSAFFAQLLSDVLGVPVAAAHVPECSALGAAICAGVGARLYANIVDGAKRFASEARGFAPDPGRSSAYQSYYNHWLEVRAARQKADELSESSAIQAIMAKAATNTAPDASKTGNLRPNILVTAAMDEEELATLRQLGEVRYESFREKLRLLTGEDLVEALAGVQVFITEVDAVDAEVLNRAPDLRVVASCRGNAVNIDIDACTAHRVLVLTAPGRNVDAVADLTVSFMLILARKLLQATQFLHQPGEEGDVGRMGRAFEGLKGHELWHKTIGIVGLGAVGQRVAKRLQPFGARVIAHDPLLSPETAVLLGIEPVSLEQLLTESDFVTLHAAVTDESRPLLGPAEIAEIKRGAYLINTARAALVDQAALVSALKNGRLAGAAVDVFPIEPPGLDHPLLQLPNVIATPHVGGNTFEVASHQGAIVTAGLAELLRGERPHNIANPEIFEHFSWAAPRPAPSPEVLARLRQNSRPSVTDLPIDSEGTSSAPKTSSVSHKEGPLATKKEGLLSGIKNAFLGRRSQKLEANAMSDSQARDERSRGHPNGGGSNGSKELRAQLERLLDTFGQRLSRDEKILSFAQGRQVTVRYDLSDINLSFYTSFDHGSVRCGLGDPPAKPEVTLKMKADILDKLFTGRENGPKAAMSGKLSFIGDTLKAMSLQRMQNDLNRLYSEVRAEVENLDGIFERAARETAAANSSPPPARALAISASNGQDAGAGPILVGDIRDEVVRAVEEMYGHGLITSTGGNISVRISDKDELWITPNSSFKGALRASMLVRIDLDGNPIGDFPYTPSSERMLHCAIYRNNSKVGAVIHSHAPKATILGLTGLPFLPISTEAAFIGEIPRVPFIMPGTVELADAVAAAARDANAVIMQNHGLIVGGSNLRRTIDMTFIIEETAEKLIVCHMLGKIPPGLPDEIVTAVRNLGYMIA